MRSMSRIPTEEPARERERASWVVMDDLPTPPLPERTYSKAGQQWYEKKDSRKTVQTSTMCFTFSRDMAYRSWLSHEAR